MADGEPIRVMVVDDQEDMRFILGVILGDHADLDLVAESAGGRDALASFEDSAPDVVVLDARMPLIDGYEMAQQMLARRPNVPIAILTASVDEEVEARGRRAGARLVVSKADMAELPDVVRRLAASVDPGGSLSR
jgi:CheY-like chemotaxis protein